MGERTTIRLPDDLIKRAKAKAANEGRTLTALIAEALRRVTSERPSGGRDGRVLPPVSAATGGVMPGIDLDNSAVLQDLDDCGRTPRSLQT
jgi:hypothetical protein